MATVDLSGIFRAQALMPSVGAAGSNVLDASTEHEGYIAVATRAFTVQKIALRGFAITGTSPTYRIGLESQADGGSSGIPSGTYLGATNNGFFDSQIALGHNEFTLGENVSLSAGQAFALTIRYQSGTIDASNNAEVYRTMTTDAATNNPCAYLFTGTYTYTSGMASKTLIDPSGNVLEDFGGASRIGNQSWNSGSTPLLRGTGLVIPSGIDLEVVGIKAYIRPSATSDFRFVLWKGTAGSSTAVTATVDVDSSMNSSSTASNPFQLGITPSWMLAGETWRFLVEPTTANSITSVNRLEFNAASHRVGAAGDFFYSSGNSGAWTDESTMTIGVLPVIGRVRYRSERPGYGVA